MVFGPSHRNFGIKLFYDSASFVSASEFKQTRIVLCKTKFSTKEVLIGSSNLLSLCTLIYHNRLN